MATAILTNKEKLLQIKAFHQKTLDLLNVPNAKVLAKMAFSPTSVGLTEKHVGFFENEITNKNEDIYLEFCSKDMSPEQVPGFPPRALLIWKYNPFYEEEYITSDPDPVTGNVRYFVPITELVIATVPDKPMLNTIITKSEPKEKVEKVKVQEESNVDELSAIHPDDMDSPMSGMTLRDYAAIHMKKPVSKKKWLNDLITK